MNYKYDCGTILDGCALTKEEKEACLELISNMRAAKARKIIIEEHRENLRSVVISTIDAIGLDETKRIIREINRNLRGEE